MTGTDHEHERQAQKSYWKEHSSEATVEAMMLDSKAKDIDKQERPEVRGRRLAGDSLAGESSPACRMPDCSRAASLNPAAH